jgi:hypothetical protein
MKRLKKKVRDAHVVTRVCLVCDYSEKDYGGDKTFLVPSHFLCLKDRGREYGEMSLHPLPVRDTLLFP